MTIENQQTPELETTEDIAVVQAEATTDASPVSELTAEEKELQKKHIETPHRITAVAKAKTKIAADNCDALWHGMLTSLLQRLGDSPENVEYLKNLTAPAQILMKTLSYNAVGLAEMHEAYINQGQELDVGAKFVMDNQMRGIYNFGFGVLPSAFNIYDPDAPGADDPRWSYDVLPTDDLAEKPGILEIPVRIETFTDIFYGHLTCFSYQITAPNGKLYTMQTTQPAIRVNKNWITPNSVHRWFRTDDQTVKNAWLTGKGHYVKKQPDLSEGNPIVDESVSAENERQTTEGE